MSFANFVKERMKIGFYSGVFVIAAIVFIIALIGIIYGKNKTDLFTWAALIISGVACLYAQYNLKEFKGFRDLFENR